VRLRDGVPYAKVCRYNPKHPTEYVSRSHDLRTETDPISKTLFSGIWNCLRWAKPRTPMILRQ
jgi:hypothetical protein